MIYPASSPENLTVLKLSLVDSPLNEKQLATAMHFSVSHLALVPGPNSWSTKILRSIENTPSIRLSVRPLSLIFYFSVGEKELSLTMHQIIFPPALIIATIIEDIFAFAVLEVVLFLADILIAICVLLVHID